MRRRLEARLRAGGQTLPPAPSDGSESARLRAARAAIDALHRARLAERTFPSAEPRSSRAPDAFAPVRARRERTPDPAVEVPASKAGPDAVAPAPSRPGARTAGEGGRVVSASRLGAIVLAVSASIVTGALGFVAGRGAESAPVRTTLPAASDVVPTADTESTVRPPDVAAVRTDALVRDNLELQRELVTLEGRLEALRPLLAPRSVAAIAAADRELALIELGGADPGAAYADIERARQRARAALREAIGPDGVEALRGLRAEPVDLVRR